MLIAVRKKSKRRNEMLLMVKKSVFQKSLERSCFENLAAVLYLKLFFACSFPKKNYEGGF